MDTTVLTLSWSVSRGRDTYGYNIARLDDTTTGKRYRCMGGGYDMVGTVFAEWLEDVHQHALQDIGGQAYTGWDAARSATGGGLYGMAVRPDGSVRLDGACGLESIRRIAEAIGLTVRTLSNRHGHTAGFVVEATPESSNYAACPDHAGYWFHKSTGACDCGAAHRV